MSPIAEDAPALNVPESNAIVKVHIINTTSRMKDVPSSLFFGPDVKGFHFMDCPAYSFLIEHASSGQKFLFDLGVRKDWENLAPVLANHIKEEKWQITVEKGVAEILEEGGVKPKDINGIIWSHHHYDHTGDPSTFPHSTDLIVGPGFKEAFTPGYPSNPESPIKDTDLDGRTVREVSFAESSLRLGRFRALDWFGDGSFYFLDSPGHTATHICALCRVTTAPSTFIFLGGDCAHHGGEFRPTPYLPLPQSISPSPLPHIHPNICPGSLFTPFHRLHDKETATKDDSPARTQPFYVAGKAMNSDVKGAQESIEKMEDFDAHENVLTIFAHDQTLLDVVGFFPKETANDWKEKGWREKGLWRFLGDFEEAVHEAGGKSE
ncbi:hypothetical protein MMC22_011968 [Lobaria immixta]|nr:hypothetical protein [Lobaria immixta]